MKTRFNASALLTALMIVLLIVGLAAMFSAWADVRQAIAGAGVGPLLIALGASSVTYTAISLRFATLGRVFNIRAPVFLLWQVGCVSTLLGRNVVGGGTAGMMLSMTVLGRRAIPLPKGATVSLVQSYVNLLIAMSMFLAAVVYVVFSGSLGSIHSGALAGTIAVLSIFAAAAAGALFGRRFRGRLIDWLVAIVKRWTGKDLKQFGIQFADAVDEGVGALRWDVGRLAAIAAMLAIETGMTLLSLWLCFESVGQSPGLGVLLAGYGIGLALGMVSLLPGGLGVQEGSMAGVYALLGVPFGEAVAVAALFRAVHYFVPFMASLVLYREMLRSGAGGSAAGTEAVAVVGGPESPPSGV